MAKAAKKVVPEVLVGLDIHALKTLIAQATERISELDQKTKKSRIEAFKKSDFLKAYNKKVKEFAAKLKGHNLSQEIQFLVTLSIKSLKVTGIASKLHQDYYYDLAEYSCTGKVEGELSKTQKGTVEEIVKDYAEGLCTDGVDSLFPEFSKQMLSVDEEFGALREELTQELEAHGLSRSDLSA
jgi:hypothetical protein